MEYKILMKTKKRLLKEDHDVGVQEYMVDNLNLFKLIRFIEMEIGVEFERNEDSLTVFDLLKSEHDAIRNFLTKNNLWSKRINEKIRDLEAKKRIVENEIKTLKENYEDDDFDISLMEPLESLEERLAIVKEYNVEDKYVGAYLYDHFEHLNLIKDKYDSYKGISVDFDDLTTDQLFFLEQLEYPLVDILQSFSPDEDFTKRTARKILKKYYPAIIK
jgi:hypothetical protein